MTMLEGRNIITGAANGIGLAAARIFSACGATSMLVERDEAGEAMMACSTSKHGVSGLTRSAAPEGAPHYIRANAVLTGAVAISMLTGHRLAVDGGLSVRSQERGPGKMER
ncbi:MAG: SDR family NAD(P)-dependent oxidoreductase [Erythrobacter sp.]